VGDCLAMKQHSDFAAIVVVLALDFSSRIISRHLIASFLVTFYPGVQTSLVHTHSMQKLRIYSIEESKPKRRLLFKSTE